MNGYVYLAPLTDGTSFKIGRSIRVGWRLLRQLASIYDFDFYNTFILTVRHGEEKYIETAMHRFCLHHRVVDPHGGSREFFHINAFPYSVSLFDRAAWGCKSPYLAIDFPGCEIQAFHRASTLFNLEVCGSPATSTRLRTKFFTLDRPERCEHSKNFG